MIIIGHKHESLFATNLLGHLAVVIDCIIKKRKNCRFNFSVNNNLHTTNFYPFLLLFIIRQKFSANINWNLK